MPYKQLISALFNNIYLRHLAIEKLQVDDFMELAQQFPVLDVRSPGEYDHAHIPGAYNLPLFTDEERKIVGTAYKQQSREVAIKLGLDFFGPKMRAMIGFTESLTGSGGPGSKKVLVHCWRGGMRSAGVAWLLDLYGFKVHTLAGGYKSYRHWIIEAYTFPFSFHILGGYTGSGKTYVLNELKKKGNAVIDLEKLAGHKGSAFGNIGMPGQPSQEMFENLLGSGLRTFIKGNVAPVWMEDESQRIGHINIPHELWKRMSQSPVLFMDVPFEERLKHIVVEYGQLDKEKMGDAIIRIRKRLGGLETKSALQYLAANDKESCFRILLEYYDKLYRKALNSREALNIPLANFDCATANAVTNADKLINNEVLIK